MGRFITKLAHQHSWIAAVGIPALVLTGQEREEMKVLRGKLGNRLRLQNGIRVTVRGSGDLAKLRMIADALAGSGDSRAIIEHSFNRRDKLDETAAIAHIYDDVLLPNKIDAMSQYRIASRWIERMMQSIYDSDLSGSLALFANISVRERKRVTQLIRLDCSLKGQSIYSSRDLAKFLFEANEKDYEAYTEMIVEHGMVDVAKLKFLHEGGASVLADGAL